MEGEDKMFSVSNAFLSNVNTTSAIYLTTDDEDPLWLFIFRKSQLIMTIIGLIANVGTCGTLIKNGQVGLTLNFL